MSFLRKVFRVQSHSAKEANCAAEGGYTPTESQPTGVRTKDKLPEPSMALSVRDRQIWEGALAAPVLPLSRNGLAAPALAGSRPFAETQIYLNSQGRIDFVAVHVERALEFALWCNQHHVMREERLVDGGSFSDGRALNVSKLFLTTPAGLSVSGRFSFNGVELECRSESQEEFIKLCLLLCGSSLKHGIYLEGTPLGNLDEFQKRLSADRENKDLH